MTSIVYKTPISISLSLCVVNNKAFVKIFLRHPSKTSAAYRFNTRTASTFRWIRCSHNRISNPWPNSDAALVSHCTSHPPPVSVTQSIQHCGLAILGVASCQRAKLWCSSLSQKKLSHRVTERYQTRMSEERDRSQARCSLVTSRAGVVLPNLRSQRAPRK